MNNQTNQNQAAVNPQHQSAIFTAPSAYQPVAQELTVSFTPPISQSEISATGKTTNDNSVSDKKKTSDKKTMSFKATTQTANDIKKGMKKYSLSLSELIAFAIHCLTNELSREQIDKLIEDRKRITSAFG